MKKVVAATRNKGKLEEIRRALEPAGIEIAGLDQFPDAPEVMEDGATFYENAVKKAKEIARHTGMTALADDSGLEVQALGGAPGVFSARYAGENATDDENNHKLLAELAKKTQASRKAGFVAVIALAEPGGRVLTAEGRCEGEITHQPRGDRGFGYDPVFYSPELGKTFGEAEPSDKLAVSHRGRALKKLSQALPAWLEEKTRT